MSSLFSEQPKMNIHTPLPELNIQDLEQMNDEEFWGYARQRAHSLPELSSHAEYIECKLRSGTCLIALRDLVEVLPSSHRLGRLPDMPAWMGGILAWRGETIAIVNLDLYLLSTPALSQTADGMLLITRSASHTCGLLVPALGLTTTIEDEEIAARTTSADLAFADNTGIVAGIYADIPILNISVLLTTLAQQIGTATDHG